MKVIKQNVLFSDYKDNITEKSKKRKKETLSELSEIPPLENNNYLPFGKYLSRYFFVKYYK